MGHFFNSARQFLITVGSQKRQPFVPDNIQHAISESGRRLNRDWPEFLRPMHNAYAERLPLVFHHFANGGEHTKETLGQSHAALSGICNDLVDRSYALLEAHPNYKNLHNVAHFFRDLATWHNGRSQDYASQVKPTTQAVEPQAEPEQLPMPGLEPQRTQRVC